MQTLTFQNITLTPAKVDSQIWLSSSDLARFLGYKQSNAVTKLYNENHDEFKPSMTTIAEVKTNGGIQKMRIFSLRGCHLIAMFARTAVAKQFRQWVLDILDKEVGQPVQVSPKLSSDDTLPLRNAVNMATGVLKLDYATIYKMVHQRFGIDEIKDLPKDEVGQAVEYVHRLMAQATPSINIPLIQNVLATHAHQNRKAKDELSQMISYFSGFLDHFGQLQDRLELSEQHINALQKRFIV